MLWQLPTTLSYARCGDQAVFLDLAADRYFALSPEHSAALEVALAGAGHACDSVRAIVATLEQRGILVRAEGEEARTPVELVSPDEEFGAQGRGSASGLLRAALAWRSAARDVPGSSLLELRGTLAASGESVGAARDDLAVIVADFRRLFSLICVQDRCLPASLAFVRTARRGGHSAALVFGVRLHPFRAHCWAQAGSLVLNDRLEVVRSFNPVASW